MSVADDHCPAVFQNLAKEQAIWRRMTRVLSREGARLWVSGFFFKAVVYLVLLFGAEMWVVTPNMGQFLVGLQDQVERRLMGRLRRRRADGNWEYTSAEASRDEVRFEPMETYIRQSQNTGVQYISTQSLLDLCEATKRKQEAQVGMRWWDQAGIDLLGTRETAAEAAEAADKDVMK